MSSNMDWLSKVESMVSNVYKNDMFNYLKAVIYNTDNKDLIEKKEKAFNALFIGIEAMNQNNYDKAINLVQNSIDIFKETQDQLRQSFSEFFMGQIYQTKEEFEKAKEYYKRSYQYLKEQKNNFALTIEEKLKELEK
ncbi:MAG: hypothetical protein A2Y41_06055 [Spirochaetes bacterium GWB1_36_13]|nr:MAG: hypothetical protein A2Y41_06055 [Spirochaetes bacterium GWB1_36_13]